MIELSHLKLLNISRKHYVGLEPWVKKRFDGVIILFEMLENSRNLAKFPKATLLNSTTDITKVKREKWVNILNKKFKDSILLDDLKNALHIIKPAFNNLLKGNLEKTNELVVKLNPIFSKYETIVNGKLKYHNGFEVLTEALTYIFDYTKFTKKKSDEKWDAYLLAENLNIKVCPYCNRTYTSTVIKKNKTPKITQEKITRPEFDHFYIKSRYPFLALSFYNLVPSCHTCNSTLKGNEKMSIKSHIHPYKEGFNNTLEFVTGITVEDYFKGTNLKDKIKLIEVKNANKAKLLRAKANMILFQLENIYNEHNDIAEEIFNKSINNPSTHLIAFSEEKTPDGNKIFNTPQDLYRHFIGNYMSEIDFHKRPLSKFQHDIAKETKLLEKIQAIYKPN